MQVLALCAALAPGLAAAAPWVGALPLGPLTAAAVPAPANAARSDAASRPACDERLEQMRGGADISPWSDMKLSGTVANNSAVNVVTGSNTVTDGAFSNASGLPMVIQNSGANVLIQNATIVNVQIK
ncbi:hypothetical protein [Pseudoduganella violaceinigra]|uniref:hypothetical protein n=1 Tax=Pseudoduganella violaceinigra TaxID=246602 RepID=UPI0003FC3853|nr:hypothetical protein [Pseudoduganella violaceinigra]